MRKHVLAACLLPLLLVAAACSTSDDGKGVASLGASVAPSATPNLSILEQGIRYAQCMRAQGLPWPDPEVVDGGTVRIRGLAAGKGEVDENTLREAQQACKAYELVLGRPDMEQKQARSIEFSRCMRQRGVDNFPDPAADGSVHLDDAVRQDPQYEQAEETCRAQIKASSRPGS